MPAVTGQRKTLYHSALRTRGGVVATLTHYPRPSKFAGRPQYAFLTLEGDATVYEFQCENEAVVETLKAVPLNVPLRITALGSKEAAHLEVEETCNFPTAGSSETSRRRDVVEPTTNARTAAQNRVQAPAPAPEAPTCSRGYWDALDLAVALVEQFKARHGREPSEAERAIATTLFIELNRSGKPLTRSAQ